MGMANLVPRRAFFVPDLSARRKSKQLFALFYHAGGLSFVWFGGVRFVGALMPRGTLFQGGPAKRWTVHCFGDRFIR